jgi:hypothetical protein
MPGVSLHRGGGLSTRLRRWKFDDLELDSMTPGRTGCVFACVALINVCDLDYFIGPSCTRFASSDIAEAQ